MSKRFSPPCPVEWEGIIYKSYNDAARALGVMQSTVRNRALKGYKCEADIRRARKWRACRWNNKEYRNMAEAARDNWISEPGMLYRIKTGKTGDHDLRGYQRSI